MVAAKAKTLGIWMAWIGVSLDHIRADIARNSWYDVDSLQEVPLGTVRELALFPHGEEAVRRIEAKYGSHAPSVPGTTSFCLGSLVEVSTEPV